MSAIINSVNGQSKDCLVHLDGVSKEFPVGPIPVRAVQPTTFSLSAGEFVLLQGPSGSGKTTLLSIMGCLLKPTAGRVTLCGHEVTQMGEDKLPKIRLRHIGFMFQSFNLFPSLTAFQNITLILKLKGYSWRERRKEATRKLGDVGLSDCMHRRPSQLSGGQQQRVSIARALSGKVDILLADEPTAALDTTTGLQIMELLRSEVAKGNKAAFVVTHDPRLERYATRVDTISDGHLELGAVKKNEPEASGSLDSSKDSRRLERTPLPV